MSSIEIHNSFVPFLSNSCALYLCKSKILKIYKFVIKKKLRFHNSYYVLYKMNYWIHLLNPVYKKYYFNTHIYVKYEGYI